MKIYIELTEKSDGKKRAGYAENKLSNELPFTLTTKDNSNNFTELEAYKFLNTEFKKLNWAYFNEVKYQLEKGE